MRLLLPAIILSSLVIAALLLWEPQMYFDPAPSDTANDVSKQDLYFGLSRAPFRSDLWLRLAAIEKGAAAERALSAAYLVGGEKIEDIPVRLRIAVLSGAFRSDALRDFVKADISMIVLRAPSLKPLLSDLDTKLGPNDRPAYDALLRDVDPTSVAY